MSKEQDHILNALYKVLLTRKNIDAKKSYVASLYKGKSPKIAEKILEEAQEVIDEAIALDKNPNDKSLQKNIREESADLLFHLMVMLAYHNIPPSEVFKVLENRFGTSGHTEKASRGKKC